MSSNRKKAKVSLQWPLGNTNPHRGSKTSGMESEDSMGAMGSNGSSFGLGALLGGSVSGAPKGPSARPSGWRRDAPIRKDALLSGPLPSLRRRMEEVEAAEEAGNGDTAAPNGGGGFRSCFSRVLRPGAQQRGYRHAGRMHIAQCLDIADHGRLLLVAGKVRMPVVDKKQSGLQYAGYLSVWQVEPATGAWREWAVDIGANAAPVTSVSVSGATVALGHARSAQSIASAKGITGSGPAAVGEHGEVSVWVLDLTSARLLATGMHLPHTNSVTALRFVGATCLLTATSGGDLTVWEVDTSRTLANRGPGRSGSSSVSSTTSISAMLAAMMASGKVDSAADLGPRKVTAIAYLESSELLALSSDKRVFVWRTQGSIANNLGVQLPLLSHEREVLTIAFRDMSGTNCAGDSELLVAGCLDYSFWVWDIDNNSVLRRVQTAHGHVHSVAFSTFGNFTVSGHEKGNIVVSDVYTGTTMRTMTGHTSFVKAVAMLPRSDEGTIVSAGQDGSLRVWELKSKPNSIVSPMWGSDKNADNALSTTYCMTVRTGNRQAITGHRDGTVRLWNASNGKGEVRLTGHTSFVFDVAMCPGADVCASACHDGTIRIWGIPDAACWQILVNIDAETGKEVVQEKEFSCLAFHPTGRYLAAGSYNKRITFFWNASDEAARPEFQRLHTVWEDHTHRVWALRFSQCGSWMATASWDKTVNVYAMSYAAVGAESPDATFTSFGEELGAMLGDEEINVPHKLNVGAEVWAATFQPTGPNLSSGTLLATGSQDSVIRLWAYNTVFERWIQQGEALEGHTNTVTDIAWHPEGRSFVSSSFDHTVRLWTSDGAGSFSAAGIWSAYSGTAAMAVSWAYQDPKNKEGRGTMIGIGTMKGHAFLMDGTDAQQAFVPFSRAKHIISNHDVMRGQGKRGKKAKKKDVKQKEDDMVQLLDGMLQKYPETLTSLGPGDKGMFLLWSLAFIDRERDMQLVPYLLDAARARSISPLLPYCPHSEAILSWPDYQLVAYVIDAVVRMHHAGDPASATMLSNGYSTLALIQLIYNHPDQAVVLLNHFGMTPCSDVVYGDKWTPHQVLVDGIKIFNKYRPEVFDSRAPEELWTGDLASKVLERGHGFLRDKPTQTIATHSTFPYLSSLPPEDWFRDLPRLHCFANKNLRYKSVYFTFLFVAFNSNDVSLFGTALVRAVVQWKWHTYGKYFFIVQGVFYFLQLFFISAEAIVLGMWYRCQLGAAELPPVLPVWRQCVPMGSSNSLVVGIGAAVLVMCLMQLAYVLYNVTLYGLRTYRHKITTSYWPLHEWVMIVTTLWAGIHVVFFPWEENAAVAVSVATFATFWKSLYFARAIFRFGGLVRLLLEIVVEMKYMVLLVGVGLLAAAFAFYTLQPEVYFELGEPDETQDLLSDFHKMFFFVFSIMLNAYEVGYMIHWFSRTMVMIFLLIQAIILLNALIALMSDTTEKIKDNIKVVALRERAGMLLDMDMVLGKSRLRGTTFRPRWLHALIRASDLAPTNGDGGLPSMYGTDGGTKLSYEAISRMIDVKLRNNLDEVASLLSGVVPDGDGGGSGGAAARAPNLKLLPRNKLSTKGLLKDKQKQVMAMASMMAASKPSAAKPRAAKPPVAFAGSAASSVGSAKEPSRSLMRRREHQQEMRRRSYELPEAAADTGRGPQPRRSSSARWADLRNMIRAAALLRNGAAEEEDDLLDDDGLDDRGDLLQYAMSMPGVDLEPLSSSLRGRGAFAGRARTLNRVLSNERLLPTVARIRYGA